MEGAWGSEGARSQDPNAPPQGEASSWLRGTDQRCRSEQRHLRSGAFPTREQFKKKKKIFERHHVCTRTCIPVFIAPSSEWPFLMMLMKYAKIHHSIFLTEPHAMCTSG